MWILQINDQYVYSLGFYFSFQNTITPVKCQLYMVRYSYMAIYLYYIFLCLERVGSLFQKFSKVSKRDQRFFFFSNGKTNAKSLPARRKTPRCPYLMWVGMYTHMQVIVSGDCEGHAVRSGYGLWSFLFTQKQGVTEPFGCISIHD